MIRAPAIAVEIGCWLAACTALAQPPTAVFKPRIEGRVRYQGEMLPAPTAADEVAIFRKIPRDALVLGEAEFVVVDQTEPTPASAEYMIKQVAARAGAEFALVVKSEDVSDALRPARPEQLRGITALGEHEMAALVARAERGGGELLVGRRAFTVEAADRFGDADVRGPVSFTLSRTHDEHEWQLGKAGPLYRTERAGPAVTIVTCPSGSIYDVKIISKRAKVFRHNRPEVVESSAATGPNIDAGSPVIDLYYTRFTIKVGVVSAERKK
ncbi:MAG: hypothetical protein JXR83_16315 [Deltaproteobacteria bacterium]|nr:hypothetical protein [Deltaproteobacteria bacterium]